MIQITQVLKQVPIFRMLGREGIDFIVERLKFKTFDADETVCKISDPGDEMFIIITGEVKICIYDDNGQNEQVVAKLGPGDYFGEMALLTGEPRSASVITTKESEMFALDKDNFDVILERYPSISMSLGKIVSRRLRETLKKASQTPGVNKIEASESGPTGSLKDIPLVDLISFCENNSLTGTMDVQNGDQRGQFEFESGQLQQITMNNKKDDAALDAMLQWTDGEFAIHVRPLTLDKAKSAAAEEKSKRIMIVNQSMVVRRVIERALKGLGYEVSTAANMAEALSAIDNRQPDIIISDVKLSDAHGMDFYNNAQQKKALPFIFIADENESNEKQKQLKEQENAHFTKTHEVSEIVKLVEKTI